MAFTQTIPVLDLRDFYPPDTRPRFIAALGAALTEIGFFALTHHGVEEALIQQAYQVTHDFFTLPEATKLRYEQPQLYGQRGFTRFGQEHAKDHPVPDLKEFWHVGRELPPDHPLTARYPANLIPVEVPQFHPVMQQLYQQLEACTYPLLQACALYLGESETWLSNMVQGGDTILRIIHYPPIPDTAPAASLRAAAHEDINLITLLCEATDDGLELLQSDGTWRAVRAVPGQIIVDSGDMLQQVTNGLIKSTTHRVVNPANQHSRRFSMPFFVHPRPEVDLTPLAACITQVGQQNYPSITAGDYLRQRLVEIGLLG
jgi:isopenicillin N synthase-like dioxygenase